MDKGKEDPVLDNADDEGDGRRSTEINIDMLAADRRDSFEVARISSPEVGSCTFLSSNKRILHIFDARACDQSTALQLSNPPTWPIRHHW